MNEPEYILTDEMQLVVDAVKADLSLSNLNYQIGYIEELNETLKQAEESPGAFALKFPLVWLAEPFTTDRSNSARFGIYGEIPADIFFINTTDKEWKAKERMDNNYKPLLYPMCNSLLKQLVLNPVFSHMSLDHIEKRITKGYYWGEGQQSVLNDAVDCLKLSVKLRISNKANCTFLTNI